MSYAVASEPVASTSSTIVVNDPMVTSDFAEGHQVSSVDGATVNTNITFTEHLSFTQVKRQKKQAKAKRMRDKNSKLKARAIKAEGHRYKCHWCEDFSEDRTSPVLRHLYVL